MLIGILAAPVLNVRNRFLQVNAGELVMAYDFILKYLYVKNGRNTILDILYYIY